MSLFQGLFNICNIHSDRTHAVSALIQWRSLFQGCPQGRFLLYIFPPFILPLYVLIEFIPLVAETLGAAAEDTICIIRSIGQSIRQRAAFSDPSNCTRHFFVLPFPSGVHGNASLWLHCHPSLPHSLEIYTYCSLLQCMQGRMQDYLKGGGG